MGHELPSLETLRLTAPSLLHSKMWGLNKLKVFGTFDLNLGLKLPRSCESRYLSVDVPSAKSHHNYHGPLSCQGMHWAMTD